MDVRNGINAKQLFENVKTNILQTIARILCPLNSDFRAAHKIDWHSHLQKARTSGSFEFRFRLVSGVDSAECQTQNARYGKYIN